MNVLLEKIAYFERKKKKKTLVKHALYNWKFKYYTNNITITQKTYELKPKTLQEKKQKQHDLVFTANTYIRGF